MADLIINYDVHLNSGRVWRCHLEVPVAHEKNEVKQYLDVTVEVIAPDQNLAQYIAMCLYPDYSTLSIDDEPIQPGTSDDFSTPTT